MGEKRDSDAGERGLESLARADASSLDISLGLERDGDEAARTAEPAAQAASEDDVPGVGQLERLMGRADYQGLSDLLGPTPRAEKLPPLYGLVYAIAHKEIDGSDPENAVNAIAIRSVASLLGLPANSRTALVVAKRVLRSHAAWRERKAPAAPARLALIIIGLLFGIVAGWLAGPGSVRLREVLEEVLR